MLAACPLPRPPPRRRLPRPPRNPWPLALLLFAAAEVCVVPLRRPQSVPMPSPAPVDGALLITQAHEWGEKPVRRIIPPPGKGDPSWAKGPCPEWQDEVSGYCWAEVAKARPPCPGGLYEHKGKCMTPITKGERPPSSIRE